MNSIFKEFNAPTENKEEVLVTTYPCYKWREYVSEITELQAECNWRGDAIERGELFYMMNALVSELSMKLGKKYGISLMSLMHTKNYFTSIKKI